MKLSASLFLCFSAIFTVHGMKEEGKEKGKDNQSTTKLHYPWIKNKDGILTYDSEPGQYNYPEKTDRQQFVKASLTTSPNSKR